MADDKQIDISEKAEEYKKYLNKQNSSRQKYKSSNESSRERSNSSVEQSHSYLSKYSMYFKSYNSFRSWKVVSLFLLIAVVSLGAFLMDNSSESIDNAESVTEIEFESNSITPTRPTVSQGDQIRFVNRENYSIEIDFDDDDDEVVEPNGSVELGFDRITYYSISPSEEEDGRRVFGSINVQ